MPGKVADKEAGTGAPASVEVKPDVKPELDSEDGPKWLKPVIQSLQTGMETMQATLAALPEMMGQALKAAAPLTPLTPANESLDPEGDPDLATANEKPETRPAEKPETKEKAKESPPRKTRRI